MNRFLQPFSMETDMKTLHVDRLRKQLDTLDALAELERKLLQLCDEARGRDVTQRQIAETLQNVLAWYDRTVCFCVPTE